MCSPRCIALIWVGICKKERIMYGAVSKYTEFQNVKQ